MPENVQLDWDDRANISHVLQPFLLCKEAKFKMGALHVSATNHHDKPASYYRAERNVSCVHGVGLQLVSEC